VLDGRQLGLNTHVIVGGCRGIELEPGDIGRALDEMKRAGADGTRQPRRTKRYGERRFGRGLPTAQCPLTTTVPLMVPLVSPVAKFTHRSTVKAPLA